MKRTIYVTCNFSLNRPGHELLKLTAGRNIVDEDVANHPYVKMHLADADAAEASEGVAAALTMAEFRIAALERQLADTIIAGNRAQLDLNDARTALDAAGADSVALTEAHKTIVALTQQLADKDAAMATMAEAYAAAPAGKAKK